MDSSPLSCTRFSSSAMPIPQFSLLTPPLLRRVFYPLPFQQDNRHFRKSPKFPIFHPFPPFPPPSHILVFCLEYVALSYHPTRVIFPWYDFLVPVFFLSPLWYSQLWLSLVSLHYLYHRCSVWLFLVKGSSFTAENLPPLFTEYPPSLP